MYDPLSASLESGFFLMEDEVDDVDVDVDERIGATNNRKKTTIKPIFYAHRYSIHLLDWSLCVLLAIYWFIMEQNRLLVLAFFLHIHATLNIFFQHHFVVVVVVAPPSFNSPTVYTHSSSLALIHSSLFRSFAMVACAHGL